jgi:TusA-related sulfurtransferase
MAAFGQSLVNGSSEIAKLSATKKIDTRGLVCPFPAFEAGKLAQSAASGDVLEIVSGDEYTATISIPSVLKIRQLDFAVIKNDDGTFIVRARKS